MIVNKSGFRSIKNLPTTKELSKFYKEMYFQDDKVRPKNYQASYSSRERQHIKLMNELCLYSLLKVRPNWKTNSISFLELGVGEGFLIAQAKSKGWDVHGVDFGSYGVKKFNPKMLDKIRTGNALEILEKMKKKKFDVCVIHNVLEHVIDPRKLLDNLRNLLNHNGIIVVTVPNDFCEVQLRALKLDHIKKKFWIMPPQHLHYFNTKNLPKFMKELNFDVIDMHSSFPIDFFLFHPGSNYITNEKNGKPTHHARVELDLIMSKAGMKNYHRLSQAFASCNVGRDLTILITPKKSMREKNSGSDKSPSRKH